VKHYSIKDFFTQLIDGLFLKNPVLVQLLGMCSTLAVTTSVTNAIGMGLATTAVLICSNTFISLLRKIIPSQIRIASYIVIISGFVTAIQLLIKAYLPDLDKSLGLFIPLIVVNCIILARAESYASKNPVLPSAVDGLTMGLGFTFALVVVSAIREILGSGSLLGYHIMPASYEPAIIFVLPSGAFLTLGFLVAIMNKIMSERDKKARLKALSAPAVEDAPAEEAAEETTAEEASTEETSTEETPAEATEEAPAEKASEATDPEEAAVSVGAEAKEEK